MNRWLAAVAALSAVLSWSCASVPQAVHVFPQIEIGASESGRGQSVAATVIDERPAGLTVQGDLKEIVQAAIADGLSKEGFKIATEKGEDTPELRVEIRSLDYTVQSGVLGGSAESVFTAKGICVFGSNRPYEQLYRGAHDEMLSVIDGAAASERCVNEAVSQALRTLVTDPSMISCLLEP